jgi:hypothetical protein
VTDEEASFKPAPDEWNIKGNLAHLIQGDRGYQLYIAELIDGHERQLDDYGDNVGPYIEATLAIHPTVTDLFEEYERACAETVELLARLPDKFIARKGTYWRLAYGLIEDPYHFRAHLSQMQSTLDAAREAVRV